MPSGTSGAAARRAVRPYLGQPYLGQPYLGRPGPGCSSEAPVSGQAAEPDIGDTSLRVEVGL